MHEYVPEIGHKRGPQRLTVDERYLVEQRALGREWSDLAAEMGCDVDTLRGRLRRALNRVADQREPLGSCLR